MNLRVEFVGEKIIIHAEKSLLLSFADNETSKIDLAH